MNPLQCYNFLFKGDRVFKHEKKIITSIKTKLKIANFYTQKISNYFFISQLKLPTVATKNFC